MSEKIKIVDISKNMKSTSDNKWIKIDQINPEISKFEKEIFFKIISQELNEEQTARILTPAQVYPKEKNVLAIHWHPEYIPLELIKKRINKTFPNKTKELIIPTQHNKIMEFNGYSGVEVDCYSKEFNRKVQLLIHFKTEKLEKADILKGMIAHTFKYRSKQLFELINAIIDPSMEVLLNKAIIETGVSEELVNFVKINTQKFNKLIRDNELIIPPDAIKNKLLRNYFDELRNFYDSHIIDLSQVLIKSTKMNVKSNFNNEYFYSTQEIIEEARSLNAGIVIPHPEQFWPILLADYDVDGYEVWNPQSRQYTEFLINVVNRQNKTKKFRDRSLLIFMGDDTHLGEKVRESKLQDPAKAGREIGVQPAWDDVDIRKSLILCNFTKENVINEYKSRLE